jgi:hypothetical protein
VYETDLERLHELFECMQMQNVKVVDDEMCRLYKGSFDCGFSSFSHDNISNNPFWHLKYSANFPDISAKLSALVTKWVRDQSEQSLQSGKKVNFHLNF